MTQEHHMALHCSEVGTNAKKCPCWSKSVSPSCRHSRSTIGCGIAGSNRWSATSVICSRFGRESPSFPALSRRQHRFESGRGRHPAEISPGLALIAFDARICAPTLCPSQRNLGRALVSRRAGSILPRGAAEAVRRSRSPSPARAEIGEVLSVH